MSYEARVEIRELSPGQSEPVIVLEDTSNQASAVIRPKLGFNCVSWTVQGPDGPTEVLWSDPDPAKNTATRCGIPILFPFPNRIRAGHFSWHGQDYQLPINGPDKTTAIHGFVCFRVWGETNCGTDTTQAWARGSFIGSRDAPECRSLWPADYELEVTYMLSSQGLRMEIQVRNPDRVPLPFGFGLHPYFRGQPEQCSVRLGPHDHAGSPTVEQWQLHNSLPTGKWTPLDERSRVLVEDGLIGTRQFDDAYHLTSQVSPATEATVQLRQGRDVLAMTLDSSFRDVVVFTPVHRQAVCIEPYTCITDAINLAGQGVETGLKVLQPGEEWRGSITWRRSEWSIS